MGYDDSKFGTGALKLINSWRTDWAVGGYSWIKYSDYGNIVRSAMTIKDLQNPGGGGNTQTSPDAPSDVTATKNAGHYVDITWSKVSNASYYRIFRANVGDASTYTEVGTTSSTSHRDTPAPNIQFYYSVVSVNDIGESEHHASDKDDKSYTDIGIAKGSTLQKPKVSWTYNDDNTIASYFIVGDIDSAATMMEVFVALSSEGPWNSFGWITPYDFYITWGEGSEYIGKQPFIKIVVSSSDGVSESSDPVQVGKQINSSVQIPTAEITSFWGAGESDYIQLSWNTDGGSVDFFEIWRYKADSDTGNDWTIGYAGSYDSVYYDYTAEPGISYYYYIFPVYQGIYSTGMGIYEPLSRPAQKANLYLYEVNYSYGQITNPVFLT